MKLNMFHKIDLILNGSKEYEFLLPINISNYISSNTILTDLLLIDINNNIELLGGYYDKYIKLKNSN